MKRLSTTVFAVLVGLALSFGSAQVDELTIWWAEWDPADFLQQVANEYQAETGITVDVVQEPWGSFFGLVKRFV